MKYKRLIATANCLLLISSFSIYAQNQHLSENTLAPAPIYAKGNYIHKSSGMVFPPAVGAFKRVGILTYNPNNSDIGVAYNSLNELLPVSITVYIYPKVEIISTGLPAAEVKQADALLEAAKLDTIKNEIMNAYPNATLTTETRLTLKQNKLSYTGKMVVFNYLTDDDSRFIEAVYLLNAWRWFIEYRINYPTAIKQVAGKLIDQFILQLAWPAN